MSFGKMSTPITLVRQAVTTDAEGFSHTEYVDVARVRCYMEFRSGTEKWANRAAFSKSDMLFRFRHIPGLEVTTDLCVRTPRSIYQLTSVEDVRGRGMYWECLGTRTEASEA